MSWQAVEAVHDHSRTRGGVREVLVAIATYADACGRGSRPSVDTLARRTNKCPRQVTRILQTLESDFPQEVRVVKGNGRGNPSTYTILLPLDAQERVTFGDGKGDISGESEPLKGDISSTKGDISDIERVTFDEIKGDISDTAPIGYARVRNPKENREEEPEERERTRAKVGDKRPPRRKLIPVFEDPPDLATVEAFCAKEGWPGLGLAALDFQAQRGWRMKSGPVYDWEAAVRTWKRNKDRYEEEDRQRNMGRNGHRNAVQDRSIPPRQETGLEYRARIAAEKAAEPAGGAALQKAVP